MIFLSHLSNYLNPREKAGSGGAPTRATDQQQEEKKNKKPGSGGRRTELPGVLGALFPSSQRRDSDSFQMASVTQRDADTF